MANSKIHAILGEMHRLLSLYSAENFNEAGRYSGIPRSLKEALFALGREAASPNRSSTRRSGSDVGVRVRFASSGNRTDRVFDLLRQSPYFDTNNTMVSFAKALGFRLPTSPKESRERVGKRLAALIEKMPQSAKDKAISELRAAQNNQTQGWVDVIKSANQ